MKFFEMNRYDANNLIIELDDFEIINNGIRLKNSEIEIYYSDEIVGFNSKYGDTTREILSNISLFDNEVQNFCIKDFQKSKLDEKNYVVELAFIDLSTNEIEFGYWGEFVNIELRAKFVKHDGRWKIKDIYWC